MCKQSLSLVSLTSDKSLERLSRAAVGGEQDQLRELFQEECWELQPLLLFPLPVPGLKGGDSTSDEKGREVQAREWVSNLSPQLVC